MSMLNLKYRGLLILGIILFPCAVFAQGRKGDAMEPLKNTFPADSSIVNGYIKDKITGEPIYGATVSYLDQSSDITDSLGFFQLKCPNYNVTIRIEMPSYKPKEVALKGLNQLNITLNKGRYFNFYDKVTLPYGEKSRSNIALNIDNIQNNWKWKDMPETPGDFFQGKIAGLNVVRRSGIPGIGANLLLRGGSSLYLTNTPLIVVDGVIQNMNSLGKSLITGYYPDPLSFIDTRDIEDITVIKNGTALYGSKGANGVILIQTTRGEQEATRIDVGMYGSMNFEPEFIPVMNADDYRIYLSDVMQTNNNLSFNDIRDQPFFDNNKNNPEYFQYHQNTNWQNLIFRNTYAQNVYLRITGGDNIAKYALSIGYLKNNGIVRNTGLTRYSTRFNTDVQLSKKLKVSADFSFSEKENKLKNTGMSLKTNPIYTALVKAPFLAPYQLSAAGVASPILSGVDSFGVSNPEAIIDNMQSSDRGYRFSGSANFSYKFNNRFSANAIIAVTMDKIREAFFIPGAGILGDTLNRAIAANRAGAQSLRRFDTYGELRVNYHNVINSVHSLSANLGMRYINRQGEGDFGLAFNTPTDQYVDVQYGNKALQQIGGTLVQSKWLDTYFSLNYDYLKKYIVTFNMSIDGSSKFGNAAVKGPVFNHGDQNYPIFSSISGAWLISSEGFMKGLPWINLLKLRAAIGMSGNDDIKAFATKKYYSSQNFLNAEGLVRGNISNPDLQWELNRKLDGGLDISVMNGRLNLSLDLYQNKTSYLLVPYLPPVASGIESVYANAGKMKNSGWDVSFNARVTDKADLQWYLGFNISHYRSKVSGLPGDNSLVELASAALITASGKAPNLFYGFKTDGVFQSDEDASKSGLKNKLADGSLVSFEGGDERFVDLNGDRIIDENDRTIIGNPNPEYFGGITSYLKWKNWSLDVLFSFSGGNDIYNYSREKLESMDNYANQTRAVINRWRVNGQSTHLPMAAWGDSNGNSRFSDRWIEDGDYLRLKMLSIGYNIPVSSGALKYIKVYATGSNLITFSHYLGYDPESGMDPNVLFQGIGLMSVPQYKSVQLGIRLGF